MKTPVLFLLFNRPDLAERVFARIREARPDQLFVAVDGPRVDRPNEAEQCAACRRIVDQIDWPCEVQTLFRDQNLGCRKAVSEAITWFFTHVEEGIILEDDCVPDMSFFSFCTELLERYRDDKRIMVISGDNFQTPEFSCGASYYFSKYPHCWGWATWRRSWNNYDDSMSEWPEMKHSPAFLRNYYRQRERVYWENKFNACFDNELDTWDYVWAFACWKHRGLTVLPDVNLVENIGWGGSATHTHDAARSFAHSVSYLAFPLVHPLCIEQNVDADEISDQWMFAGIGYSWGQRVLRAKWWCGAYIRKHLARFICSC